MSELSLENISKKYGDIEVLRNINLEIERGELIVFVGPSGCGKSTLLRMIAGLELITSGTLSIEGQVVNDIPPAQRGIAMVFQSYALYPHMTVRENMEFSLKIAKKSRNEINTAVEEAARTLQLDQYLDRLPKALSGGQRQRVAIGRAIVRDPKVFLFDEPLSNLDAALRVATRIEIAQLKQKLSDATMVYVTHDQVEAMTLATRIVVLHDGDIEQVGPPLDLYERPANEFVAQFIGSPAMNLIPGVITESGSQTIVTLETGSKIRTNIPSNESLNGAQVNVGIRPEDFEMSTNDPAYSGTVEISEALGEVTVLYFKVPANEGSGVIAKLSGIHSGLNAKQVNLSVDPSKVHLFKDGKSLLYA